MLQATTLPQTMPQRFTTGPRPTGLCVPELFFNRELSWLEAHAQLLEEAEDPSTPILERVKLLSFFSDKMDDFFMVRVADLQKQAVEARVAKDRHPDGLHPRAQLDAIARRTRQLLAQTYRCWSDSLRPALGAAGIHILNHDELNESQLHAVETFFQQVAFPLLTPMAIDPSHPKPVFRNRAIYVAALLSRRNVRGPQQLFAVVSLPQSLPRLVPVGGTGESAFVFLEDVITARMPKLFGGFDVVEWTTFRLTRDSDMASPPPEAGDIMQVLEMRLKARQRAQAVRLEIVGSTLSPLTRRLIEAETNRDLASAEEGSGVYLVPGPLDLGGLAPLAAIEGRNELRYPPVPCPPSPRKKRRQPENMFAKIASGDILLHHPYQSFDPVTEFVNQAARDPDVLSIGQTLYRTSGDSELVAPLIRAAENGKQVTAIVELKARFDEAANVRWAREMQRAGVHVVFGFADLKTHCKLLMIVRQEPDGPKGYVHLATGNYHHTALPYTDLGLFTADADIVADAGAVFNMLTGYAHKRRWRKLIVAPDNLHRRTIQLIEEQAQRARDGKSARIFAKLNSLGDPQVIEALYRASQNGVPIDLVVRGVCGIRPGIPGVSENIRVRSIVDRFHEHSRLFVFGPDAAAKVFLSSADWMPRNFHRRVEIMFPVENAELREHIVREIVPAYLRDNTKSRMLRTDGTYTRAIPASDDTPYRCQQDLIHVYCDDKTE